MCSTETISALGRPRQEAWSGSLPGPARLRRCRVSPTRAGLGCGGGWAMGRWKPGCREHAASPERSRSGPPAKSARSRNHSTHESRFLRLHRGRDLLGGEPPGVGSGSGGNAGPVYGIRLHRDRRAFVGAPSGGAAGTADLSSACGWRTTRIGATGRCMPTWSPPSAVPISGNCGRRGLREHVEKVPSALLTQLYLAPTSTLRARDWAAPEAVSASGVPIVGGSPGAVASWSPGHFTCKPVRGRVGTRRLPPARRSMNAS